MTPPNQSNILSSDSQGDEELSPIRVLSSMAPRLILEELLPVFLSESGLNVQYSAMGGVKAVEQVRSGDDIDVVVLSKNAINQLKASHHLMTKVVDVALSEVVVAVQTGHPLLGLSSESDLKNAVLSANTIGLSTGPSGDGIKNLIETWGIFPETENKLICPPPGIPVGSLIATGEVEIGFQQHSELKHIPGLKILGPLPAPLQIQTTFSAGIRKGTHKLTESKQFLKFLKSSRADNAKISQGMLPV